MKIRNPKNRFDLKIKSGERVLEVGGGHNPHPRANVVVDKYADSNFHRSGDLKVLKQQTFMEADGEALPFKDKEFDYVICCHVLEHAEDPVKFLSEQFRVAKRGYIETPSLLGEYLFPRISHKWILHEYKDVLYLVDKEKLGFIYGYDLGELVQDYLPTHSIGFKIVERTHPNLINVRIEWETNFDYVVEPQDPEIRKYFSGKWDIGWGDDFFPRKSMWQEFKDASSAFSDITKSVFKSKVLKKKQ
jgi:SAM-dependent methyltransferase